MAAQDSQGRYVTPAETPSAAQLASAARTTSTNGTAFDTSGVDSVSAALVITARSGTNPTLDVVLETTADGTNYYTVLAFPQQTNTTTGVARVFGPLGSLSRWKWTVGGTDTPSFTFAITAGVDRDA
jgi:hypothetical protein